MDDDIRHVLSDVTEIWILGEFAGADHTSCLDDVRVGAAH